MGRKPKIITCVLCNEQGPNSEEDVIPLWLARSLHAGHAPYWDLKVEIQGNEMVTVGERRVGGLPVMKLPEVCEGCNNGWMANLEQTMQRAGKRLIDGKDHTLHPWEQVIVATWMTKTALLYDVLRGNAGDTQAIPLELGCHRFYQTGQPLPRSQVLLGPFQPPDDSVLIPHRRKIHCLLDPATRDIAFHAIDVTFMFRHLVVHILMHPWDELPDGTQQLTHHHKFVQCWPIRESITWRPEVHAPPPAQPDA